MRITSVCTSTNSRYMFSTMAQFRDPKLGFAPHNYISWQGEATSSNTESCPQLRFMPSRYAERSIVHASVPAASVAFREMR